VISAGGVIVGRVAGLMVMVRVTGVSALPQASVAVQVSVTVPPQAPDGIGENVEVFDIPVIRQPPDSPLVNAIVLEAGNAAPQAIVMAAGAVMVGKVAGLIVIVRVTGTRALPQASVAVHVSITVPPQVPGIAEKVEGLEVPLIRQLPVSPLVKGRVLEAGKVPQATVIPVGAVIVGRVAGLIVIIWV
jgi:hypothetical protein